MIIVIRWILCVVYWLFSRENKVFHEYISPFFTTAVKMLVWRKAVENSEGPTRIVACFELVSFVKDDVIARVLMTSPNLFPESRWRLHPRFLGTRNSERNLLPFLHMKGGINDEDEYTGELMLWKHDIHKDLFINVCFSRRLVHLFSKLSVKYSCLSQPLKRAI